MCGGCVSNKTFGPGHSMHRGQRQKPKEQVGVGLVGQSWSTLGEPVEDATLFLANLDTNCFLFYHVLNLFLFYY